MGSPTLQKYSFSDKMTFYLPAGCHDTNDIWWHYCSLFKCFNFKCPGLNYQPEYRLCISNDGLHRKLLRDLHWMIFCIFAVRISMHINSHSKLMGLIKGEGDIGGDIRWRAHHTLSNTSSPSAPYPHPAQMDRSALILAGRTVMTSPLTVTILLMPSMTYLSAAG